MRQQEIYLQVSFIRTNQFTQQEWGGGDMMLELKCECILSLDWMHKQQGKSVLYPIKIVRDGA